ncbi:MAG: hypothetical protein Kow00121_37490 [Elainellaceae cyanobacterium]
MAPKKLSDADRQDILKRYRLPEETTVTIADHYGVSTSTISRILKQTLSEDEYESLIQQKRSGVHRTAPELPSEQPELPGVVAPPRFAPPITKKEQNKTEPAIAPPRRRQRRRTPLQEQAEAWEETAQLELTESMSDLDKEPQFTEFEAEDEDNEFSEEFVELGERELEEIEAELERLPVKVQQKLDREELATEELDEEELDEEELDEEELDKELEGELEEDDLEDEDLEDLEDEDFDDEDEDEDFEQVAETAIHIQGGKFVNILPLSEADIPKTCYVVVDRASELITRPLRDFADLGQIPDEETLEKTLPIFDNHRVAKRFMRRMQRIVKVPDGRLLQKVSPYLQAKGITRLLIDGQVYSI